MVAEQALLQQVNEAGLDEVFGRMIDFYSIHCAFLSKLDGDARGGAALSVRFVTGQPIMFASTGEKLDDFDVFHPERMASRILGMGDMLTLIEQAQQTFDEDEAERMAQKVASGNKFTLEDFLEQMLAIRRMGPLQNLLGMLPGAGQMKDQLNNLDERDLDSIRRLGASTKDPSRTIGHKGIGFKSVLDITDSPQITSECLSLCFNRARSRRRVRGAAPEATAIPVLPFPFPLDDADVAPPEDAALVQRLLGDGFATVVRLPFRADREDVAGHIARW